MVDVVPGLGKPQKRFIGGAQCALAISCKAVFIVPDDLTTVLKSEFVHDALDPALVMVDSIDEDVSSIREHTVGGLKPFTRPLFPLGSLLVLFPDAKILGQVVRRISNDKVELSFGQAVHAFYTASDINLLNYHLLVSEV